MVVLRHIYLLVKKHVSGISMHTLGNLKARAYFYKIIFGKLVTDEPFTVNSFYSVDFYRNTKKRFSSCSI